MRRPLVWGMVALLAAGGGARAAEPPLPWPSWLTALGVREVRARETRLGLDLPFGRLELVLAGSMIPAGDGLRLELAGRQGTLRLPAAGVALEALNVTVQAPPARGDGELVARLQGARVRPLEGRAPARPLALGADARLRGTLLGFVARLSQDGGASLLRLEGRHDLASGEGAVTLRGEPIRFAPGGLQPRAILPRLGDSLTEVAGEAGVTGEIRWGGRPTERVQLLVKDLSFTTPIGRFERLSGAVTFTGLFPPRTAEGQEVALAGLDVGLPLGAGQARFALRPDGRLHVDRLGFELAGGALTTGPLDVPLEAPSLELVLAARGLDLARLLDIVAVEGLTGTGTIDGTLPVEVVEGREVVVRNGHLEARGPGLIRYRPAAPPQGLAEGGAGVDLMLQALGDFRYDSLSMRLDGRTEGDMLAGLTIKGRNPGLYGGHPVEFNLNLEGQLASIVRRGIGAYRIPDSIARQLGDFFR